MTDYFQIFKELKENSTVGSKTPLSDRITFDDDRVFLDGNEAFKLIIPEKIRVIGIMNRDNGGAVHIGTTNCCHGSFYRLILLENKLQLSYMTPVDTNVMDILPLIRDSGYGVLVCGIGCSGDGVRLLDLDNGKNIDIITTEQYRELTKDGNGYPRFAIGENEIWLGQSDENEQSTSIRKYKNLDEVLKNVKIDMGKTIEAHANYKTMRPK